MFNLAFISHFYAVVIRIIQMFQTQDAMLKMRCDHPCCIASLKFYVVTLFIR